MHDYLDLKNKFIYFIAGCNQMTRKIFPQIQLNHYQFLFSLKAYFPENINLKKCTITILIFKESLVFSVLKK